MAQAVIVGGGITGTLTAHALASVGWKVTLLEGAHLGAGSSSRTAAGIRQQFTTPATVAGMRYAVDFYSHFTERVGGDTRPIVQHGYLFLSGDPQQAAAAKARVTLQQGAGLAEVEWLPQGELQTRFPWLSPDLLGGTFCPTDGFLLPHLVYMEAAAAAQRHGATIVQGAQVLGADHAGGRITSLRTSKGNFGADLFLDCTNAWTRRTARLLGAADLPVDPLKRYLWFLSTGGALPPEIVNRMPLTIGPTGAYFRPENPELLLVGKLNAAEPEVEFTMDDQDVVHPDYDHRGGPDAWSTQAWMELADFVPAAAEMAGYSATTCGYYATTPDHNPYLGYDPLVANLIRLVGFSGHGAMFGPFTAAVGAALARAGHNIDAVTLRGQTIPLAAFAMGRTPAHHEDMVI